MKALLPFIRRVALLLALSLAFGLSAPAQDLPREIKVGNEVYALRQVDYMAGGIVGDTDTKARIIRVLNGQKPADARDTLLHELLHAAANQSGKDYQEKKRLEEDFVERMTPRLLLILRDNPKIVDYLLHPAT